MGGKGDVKFGPAALFAELKVFELACRRINHDLAELIVLELACRRINTPVEIIIIIGTMCPRPWENKGLPN